MQVEKIKETIDKVPIVLMLVAYLAYNMFQYYTFETDSDSPKGALLRQIKTSKETNAKLQKKYEELTAFAKSLEQKKIALRELAGKLQEVKVTLSENVDVPGFMKMVTTEATKLNLSVLTLKPSGSEPQKFYGKVKFVLGFQGIFLQLVSFIQRLSNLSRIIHIDSIKVESVGSNVSKFIMLKGELELVVFRYIGSQEDKLGAAEPDGTGGHP